MAYFLFHYFYEHISPYREILFIFVCWKNVTLTINIETMPREKMPDNLQDFTTMYMQRPVAKIIEELFILKTNSRELKVTNQKLAKNDPTKLKDEIKRLREIEKKYNKIMAFATNTEDA